SSLSSPPFPPKRWYRASGLLERRGRLNLRVPTEDEGVQEILVSNSPRVPAVTPDRTPGQSPKPASIVARTTVGRFRHHAPARYIGTSLAHDRARRGCPFWYLFSLSLPSYLFLLVRH